MEPSPKTLIQRKWDSPWQTCGCEFWMIAFRRSTVSFKFAHKHTYCYVLLHTVDSKMLLENRLVLFSDYTCKYNYIRTNFKAMSPDASPQRNVIHYGEISQNGVTSSGKLRLLKPFFTVIHPAICIAVIHHKSYNSNGCDCSIVHVFAWEGPCSTASADLHPLI